jgi:hypothetical protein
MTTFRRFCEYVDAAHKMSPTVPHGASYGQVVAALADAGFVGATVGELPTLARHMRGFTDTRRERTTLLKETIQLMRQYGIVDDPEFGADPVSRVVPAEDMRGQTVIHDLRQFEADVREAARLIGKPVPSLPAFDAEKTAENVFAWVYALCAGLLSPTGS